MQTDTTLLEHIVGQQLPTLRPFARSLKEPVKCGLSEMNNVIGMIMESRLWSGGFDSFWRASRWGIWQSKLPTYRGIWPKPSKKNQIPKGLRRGMGSFVIDWYIMSATWRRLTGSLKPGFHMIATIATIALIAAIAEKQKFSYRSDHSDHMETWLFRVRSDDDRWDRTTLSYSLTSKIPTLSSI